MNILIRLPNWLGDMVMSTAFVQAVQQQYPDATIDLIAKKGLDPLLENFPQHGQGYIFSKKEYKGLTGAFKFGRLLRSQKKYDLFFCLPDSFSSAVMGYAIAAKQRIGFKKELRSISLTHAFQKKRNLHRVEEYIDLLQQFTKKEIPVPAVQLMSQAPERKNALIININSEASSRRLPKEKAIQLIDTIRNKIDNEIILVGSHKEKSFVDEVYAALPDKTNIANKAGQTSLQELVTLMGSNAVMLTTDSGPAHVANALGVHTIVLFGAGNEQNTAPYNVSNRSIIRLGQLACEPCVSNTCKLYDIPQCLARLDERLIALEVSNVLK
ncbi:MAG TPA: lipopolysaccharide heptosyltransferase II [Ferruginibacter sp.]|nr:lipopolysaccharide heptosyltransferase II [Ferruginibacter sp.]